ncbi:hypothetical protein ACJX0J_018460 [Zea mays]
MLGLSNFFLYPQALALLFLMIENTLGVYHQVSKIGGLNCQTFQVWTYQHNLGYEDLKELHFAFWILTFIIDKKHAGPRFGSTTTLMLLFYIYNVFSFLHYKIATFRKRMNYFAIQN